jgi:hypothetical protein
MVALLCRNETLCKTRQAATGFLEGDFFARDSCFYTVQVPVPGTVPVLVRDSKCDAKISQTLNSSTSNTHKKICAVRNDAIDFPS